MISLAIKVAARRIGIDSEEYKARCIKEKWCCACKAWHDRIAFDRDSSRGDGLRAQCRVSRRTKPRTELERFLSKTKKHRSGCLLWTGSHYPSGYGSFWIGGKLRGAHRASWLLFCGPIPPGQYVLHRCDIRLCVNPKHLFLGTHQDNMDDMSSKGRRASVVGENNPKSKLAGADVHQIRRLKGMISQQKLADAFGVSKTAIRYVQQLRNWREFPLQSGIGEVR